MPFAIKIATKDWHPANHVSFASNHPGKQPYTSFTEIVNPANPDERYQTRLWPDHCVQGTPGAEIIPELDQSKFDKIVEKGTDPRVEMYSAFYDPLKAPRCSDSGLAEMLRERGVSDVFVVGLASDYCVLNTAMDAAREGFRTVIVAEATRAVDPGAWATIRKDLPQKGVGIVSIEGPEVKRVVG
jgi:nicotinamidase-related amidase